MATGPVLRSPSILSQTRLYEVLLIVIGLTVTIAGSIGIGATNYGPWIFGGVLAIVGSIAILLRPELGIYALVIFIFANLSDVLETQFGIPDLNKFLIALLFVGTLASRVVLRKKPVIFRFTEIVILAYGIVVIASLFFAPGTEGGIGLVVDWMKDYAILLIIVQFATNEHTWKRAQWMLILTAALLALFSTYQVITEDFDSNFFGLANAPVFQITEDFDSNRVTGPLDDPNFYAMVQLMVLPMAAYRFMTDPHPRNRLIGLSASGLIAATVLATYSRGAFLALVVTGILIMRERRMNPYKVLSVVLVLLVIVIPFLPAGFVERLSTLADFTPGNLRAQTELSLRGRSSEAIVAYQMFQDHPVLGVGRGNYINHYLDYASRLALDNRNEPREAHSLYLELGAETGVLGIITFGAMLVTLFWGMRRAREIFLELERPDLVYWVTGIWYGLLTFLLASVFLHAAYVRYFWLIIGLAASCSVLAKSLKTRFTDPRIVSRISPIT